MHNGIIENFRSCARELTELGHPSAPQTDTEAVAILSTRYLDEGIAQGGRQTLHRLEGAFGLGFPVRRRARIS